jgi:predicted O-methyltransferase YrrM
MDSELADAGRLPLDLIGVREGTDKSSLIGDYLRFYDALFDKMRHDEFNFIEIGVFNGASARMWEQYFTRARIIGVDIDPRCRGYATDRVHIEIGSQNDPEFLHHLAASWPPRVVIDDGSHQSYDIIFTFERLFPVLQPGGVYVIEDLHFHLIPHEAERLRGGSEILAHDYVAGLARDRLRSETSVKELHGLRRYLIENIDRIEIFGQAAVFHKKQRSHEAEKLNELRPHVEASDNWLNWLIWSMRSHDAGLPWEDSAAGLRKAISLNSRATVIYERLSEILESHADIDGAIAVAQDAIAIGGADSELGKNLTRRIAHLETKRPH